MLFASIYYSVSNLGFIEFKVTGTWLLISLLSYKIWSTSVCNKSVDAVRFVWLRCPNTSCRPFCFHCGSPENTAYMVKLIFDSSLKKKKICKLVNQFQPNLTRKRFKKHCMKGFGWFLFISLKKLFVPKGARPF